jgi:hypothetical protein
MWLRKIADEADARKCLAAVARSGGDLGAWTRAHGVDGRSLNLWKLNLERRPRRASARPESKALTVVELVPDRGAPVVLGARYALEVAGVRLELGDDFQEDAVRRLVRVLRSC